jgi:hypothetical protein
MSYIKEEKQTYYLPRKTPIGAHRLGCNRCPTCGKNLGQVEPSRFSMGIIGWIIMGLIAFVGYKMLLSPDGKKTKRYFRKVKPLPIPR